MSKSMIDPIAEALKEYERASGRNNKRAVLLTPQSGYFLYENRFCSILDYELEFQSPSYKIQGSSVPKSLFLDFSEDKFQAVSEDGSAPERVDLIFHIDLGDGELLRGILLVVQQNFRFSMFCDDSIEELYRFSRRSNAKTVQQIPPDEALEQYADGLRRNDLHGLTGLYLRGKSLRSIFVEIT